MLQLFCEFSTHEIGLAYSLQLVDIINEVDGKISKLLAKSFSSLSKFLNNSQINCVMENIFKKKPHKSHLKVLASCLASANAISASSLDLILEKCLESIDSQFNETVYHFISSDSSKIYFLGNETNVLELINEDTLLKLAESDEKWVWEIIYFFVSRSSRHACWLIEAELPFNMNQKERLVKSCHKYFLDPNTDGHFYEKIASMCHDVSDCIKGKWYNQVFGRDEVFFIENFTCVDSISRVTGKEIFNDILNNIESNYQKACANTSTSLNAIMQLLPTMALYEERFDQVVLLTLWILRQYFICKISGNDELESVCNQIISLALSMIRNRPECLKYLGKTILKSFITAALKNRLGSKSVTELLIVLIADSLPDGFSPQQMLTMITSHSLYDTIISSSLGDVHPAKCSLLNLIYSVISKDTASCCSTTEVISQLCRNYGGTLGPHDVAFLSIMKLFEEKGGFSVVSCATSWGNDIQTFQPGEALNMIDSAIMASTIHNFPFELDIQLQNMYSPLYPPSNAIYDPGFFLPLAGCLLTDYVEHVDLHRLIESNLLGLAVMAIASTCTHTRYAGHFVLSSSYSLLTESTLKERNQILHLLDYLRNSILVTSLENIKPIPSIIASFIAQSLMILLKPESDMYPVINTFLLQRPLLDLDDIPLFYSLFYSSGTNSRSERIWILRLLKNGLNSDLDFHVIQRRHAMELLFTFFSSSLSDLQTRKLTMEIILKASMIPSAISELVTKLGLLNFFKSVLFSPKMVFSANEISNLKLLIKKCLEGFEKTPVEWDGPIDRGDWIQQFKLLSSAENGFFENNVPNKTNGMNKRNAEFDQNNSKKKTRKDGVFV